jgi:hypothetical protein
LTLSHLDAAIVELEAAKRMAKTFHWPEEYVQKLDLLKRGAANLARLMRANGQGEYSETEMRT